MEKWQTALAGQSTACVGKCQGCQGLQGKAERRRRANPSLCMQGRQIVQDLVLRQRRPHTLSAGRRSQDGVRQGVTWHRRLCRGATGGGIPTSHAHRPPCAGTPPAGFLCTRQPSPRRAPACAASLPPAAVRYPHCAAEHAIRRRAPDQAAPMPPMPLLPPQGAIAAPTMAGWKSAQGRAAARHRLPELRFSPFRACRAYAGRAMPAVPSTSPPRGAANATLRPAPDP